MGEFSFNNLLKHAWANRPRNLQLILSLQLVILKVFWDQVGQKRTSFTFGAQCQQERSNDVSKSVLDTQNRTQNSIIVHVYHCRPWYITTSPGLRGLKSPQYGDFSQLQPVVLRAQLLAGEHSFTLLNTGFQSWEPCWKVKSAKPATEAASLVLAMPSQQFKNLPGQRRITDTQ